MSYLVMARKYRPRNFAELIGQNHIVRTVQNAIEKDRISHAYIFAGSRGVGKTTAARLLAKAINCEKGPAPEPCNQCSICVEITEGRSLDVIEIDGASNRGIDQVRQLRENVKFSPSRARYKVYIIDEVHMLTMEAFNALLKTLEEPPSHVKFIFATTEPDRLPPTIQSRCQRFDFRLLTREEIIGQLETICEKEGYKLGRRAFLDISRAAEGSLRDALSLLEQVISFAGADPDAETIEEVLHLVRGEILERFIGAVADRDQVSLIRTIDELASRGFDMRSFLREVMEWLRGMMIISLSPELEDLIPLAEEDRKALIDLSGRFKQGRLQALIQVAVAAEGELKRTTSPRYVMELAALKMATTADFDDFENLIRKLEDLKGRLHDEETVIPESESGQSRQKKNEGSSERSSKEKPAVTRKGKDGIAVDEAGAVKEVETGPSKGEEEKGEGAGGITRAGGNEWENFLKKVEKRKIALSSYLEQGKLLGLDEHRMVIGFAPPASIFLESAQENDNPAILQEAARELFGPKVRIKLQMMEEGTGEESSENKRRSTDLMRKREKEALSNPLVQEIIDTFGGRILDVNTSS